VDTGAGGRDKALEVACGIAAATRRTAKQTYPIRTYDHGDITSRVTLSSTAGCMFRHGGAGGRAGANHRGRPRLHKVPRRDRGETCSLYLQNGARSQSGHEDSRLSVLSRTERSTRKEPRGGLDAPFRRRRFPARIGDTNRATGQNLPRVPRERPAHQLAGERASAQRHALHCLSRGPYSKRSRAHDGYPTRGVLHLS
jgi:hypothetical protein